MEEKKVKYKNFESISWLVDEDKYREDSALSYSTLAKYEREGFNKLDKLFDKVESPSLTFGSAVDAVITGTFDEFDKRFIVIDFPEISDSLVQIARILYDTYHESCASMTEIPDSILADVGKECGYYTGDKYANYRVKMIKENCTQYYDLLSKSEGKQIISKSTFLDVENTVKALKTSDTTKHYFEYDNPTGHVQRFYQLKFKATFEDINFRCMADLLVVDHSQKIVMPVDLKTSSHPEWEFYKSFVEWNYQIQARLYWRIIRSVMDNDEYFKDFKLADYRFIVANRNTLTPLVWVCPFTRQSGNITFNGKKTIIMRDPFVIAKELLGYLEYRPLVPNGIDNSEYTTGNDLREWINKEM